MGSRAEEDEEDIEEMYRRRDEASERVRCARCGKPIPGTSTRCPECGVHFRGHADDFRHPIDRERAGTFRPWMRVAAIVAFLGLLMMLTSW